MDRTCQGLHFKHPLFHFILPLSGKNSSKDLTYWKKNDNILLFMVKYFLYAKNLLEVPPNPFEGFLFFIIKKKQSVAQSVEILLWE